MSITIQDLIFSYPDKTIFKNYSVKFDNGVFYSLTAPSGKGKTTLFRLITGLEKPDSGKIDIIGKLAYMFQEDRLFPNLTVLENIMLTSDNKDSAKAVLQVLGIIDEANSYPDSLSGGMKRRVALARTLLAKSDNVILDEPFVGLDEAARDKAIELIKKMCYGKTLIISTHDPSEREFCDEHVILM